MSEHELEIEILKDGTVRAKVSGAKGPGCLEYAKALEAIVGRMTGKELTAEYYEPGPPVRVDAQVRQKRGG
jgi:hypothetical protein